MKVTKTEIVITGVFGITVLLLLFFREGNGAIDTLLIMLGALLFYRQGYNEGMTRMKDKSIDIMTNAFHQIAEHYHTSVDDLVRMLREKDALEEGNNEDEM